MESEEQTPPTSKGSIPTFAGRMGKTPYVVILILILVGAGIFFYLSNDKEDKNFTAEVKSRQYQAVFLTNGQVYFGKLVGETDDYLKLREIYYLQVQQDVQGKDNTDEATADGQNLSLAKLGEELHGPEDVMFISRDQVLFWENLKNGSKVVTAIKSQ